VSDLKQKKVVVIGGSRGAGRSVVESAALNGAHVLAVARDAGRLGDLTREVVGIKTLSIDATDETSPEKVFSVVSPDALVLCAGAFPPAAPLHRLTWQEFSANWESDVKMAFHFCVAALNRPLKPGSSVVVVSSGAALGGSPISGGYAGAKRTQMFIANYAQKESDRLGLGIRFTALAPRIMPDTELGSYAVAAYARYLNISEADFLRGMDSPPSVKNVASAVLTVVSADDRYKGKVLVVSGKGLEEVGT
jgi:NAD(P)-dependent dehydrogenase (short-subunit alcohol dehydrogenase family)